MRPGKKILAIDDEEELLDVLGLWLQNNNYEVITARDGHEGLKRAKEAKPDLIFLDLMMPGLDGFGVLEQLRSDKETSSIPVVILTAHGMTSHILKAQALRVKDLLIKPFKFDDVLEILEKHTL